MALHVNDRAKSSALMQKDINHTTVHTQPCDVAERYSLQRRCAALRCSAPLCTRTVRENLVTMCFISHRLLSVPERRHGIESARAAAK